MPLTLIGLGVEKGDLSLAAAEKIRTADAVIIRTALTQTVGFFKENGIPFVSMDDLYAGCRNFDTLAQKIARRVYALSRGKRAVYCVDGSVLEDNACKLILSRHPSTAVIAGVSKASAALAPLGITGGYTSVSAYDVADGSFRSFGGTLFVYDLDSAILAGEVKLKLMSEYGDECPCTAFFVGKRRDMPLYEMDRLPVFDHSAAIVLTPRGFLEKDAYDAEDLRRIIELLRADGGCPWDRAQTHKSIRKNAVEEVYEMIDAINRCDDERLREEIGDVMMQAVFHAVMAEERGAFTYTDVTTEVCRKLISRHTHIFFGDKAADEREALEVWEKNKRKEHGFTPEQAVADVPASLPALMRAQKLIKRATKAGYAADDAQASLQKAAQIAARLVGGNLSDDEIMRDSGDFLFECVNVVRLAGADAEEALADKADAFAKPYIAAAASQNAAQNQPENPADNPDGKPEKP